VALHQQEAASLADPAEDACIQIVLAEPMIFKFKAMLD